MTENFDWTRETSLKGTVSRVGQFVRGDCARCPQTDVLVYDDYDDATLLCADCSRRRSIDNPRVEMCDECGGTPAWRDPVTGKNDFYCAKCHAAHGRVFQNRWANSAREGRVLGQREKIKCDAAGYGTDCKGEIKWRGAYKRNLCNFHAGTKSANPFNN